MRKKKAKGIPNLKQTELRNKHSAIFEINKMAVELAQQQAAGAVVDAAQKPGVVADYIDGKLKSFLVDT
jgi:hypothetical protein